MAAAEAKTITVWLRTKPADEEERGGKCVKLCPGVPTEVKLQLMQQGAGHEKSQSYYAFKFNRVLGEDATQEDVFNSRVPEIIDQAFAGRNVLISTYGQTSSGKTFTMVGEFGQGEHAGVLPRAFEYCFAKAAASPSSVKLLVQMMEIYNEDIRDLLEPHTSPSKLLIRNDSHLGTSVRGLRSFAAANCEEAMRTVQEAIKNRSVAQTKMNKHSSRSHVLCFVCLHDKSSDKVISRIGFADLAGSERQAKTGTSGEKLREGGAINRSLSALEKVVNDVHNHQKQKQASTKHVNFRDSKLTRILQPFFIAGNGGLSVFILCVSPSSEDAAETCNTMKFGQRLQGISQPVKVQHRQAPAREDEDCSDAALDGQRRLRNKEADSSGAAAAAATAAGLLAAPPPSFFMAVALDFAWSVVALALFAYASKATA